MIKEMLQSLVALTEKKKRNKVHHIQSKKGLLSNKRGIRSDYECRSQKMEKLV